MVSSLYFRDAADVRRFTERADSMRQRRIEGLPGHQRRDYKLRSYFDVDPEMSTQQKRKRLEDLRDAGLIRDGAAWDIARMESRTLENLEPHFLKEARDKSHTCGRLFWTENRDRAGRLIETAEGDPNTWMKPFKRPGVSLKFNNVGHLGKHYSGGWIPNGTHLQVVSDAGPYGTPV